MLYLAGNNHSRAAVPGTPGIQTFDKIKMTFIKQLPNQRDLYAISSIIIDNLLASGFTDLLFNNTLPTKHNVWHLRNNLSPKLAIERNSDKLLNV